MANNPIYQPTYNDSWAIVIGIDSYEHCSPLSYACNDARAMAAVLVDKMAFPKDNVELLLDGEATRAAILDALLRHADNATAHSDDRGLIFFAGHGHTAQGRRGEVGYLVPADGDCDNLASLIRWDELTRNAELLAAKHLWFIMDACYGGLACTRHLHPGSRRFLKDMLCRLSRQVLAAGKADQEVADGDGPRPGNSIFTGHLLDALEGAAAKDGYLTANGVMAYVYDRVAKDPYSQQTPHYGFIDGDGDFILSELPTDLLGGDTKIGTDVLIAVPENLIDQEDPDSDADKIDLLKEYLSEPRYRIKLDDLVSAEVRRAVLRTGDSEFPLQHSGRLTAEDAAKRLNKYEEVIRPVVPLTVLLGRWATTEQRAVLENMLARLSDNNSGLASGMVLWIGMRWYPISFLMYAGGIAALSSGNFDSFASIHLTKIDTSNRGDQASAELIVPVVDGMQELEGKSLWKLLPGHERHYAAHSEYMFKVLQPVLEDLLFLGASYERLFDRYEIFRALTYADLQEGGWGPVGRFGWKYSGRMRRTNPYTELRAEADLLRDGWPPFKAGLFRGSYKRFDEVAKGFEANVLNRLQWF